MSIKLLFEDEEIDKLKKDITDSDKKHKEDLAKEELVKKQKEETDSEDDKQDKEETDSEDDNADSEDDNADSEDDNADSEDDNADDDTTEDDNAYERLKLFKNYKSLLSLSDKIIDSINKSKLLIVNNKNDENSDNTNIINYIDTENNKSREQINFIINNSIKTLSTEKLNLIFISFCSKLELMVNLLEQINNNFKNLD